MALLTFIGYTHPVMKSPDEPFYETACEYEEHLLPVDDFISELMLYPTYSELVDAVNKSDITDVLILRGW